MPFLSFALNPAKSINQYIHEIWKIEDGLPQSSAYSIVQTRDGYIWIGTAEGLVRFDGINFTVFDKLHEPELGSNWIRNLLEDSSGNLWIATSGGGLVLYKNGVFKNFGIKDGLPSDIVQYIFEDSRKRLWIGMLSGGAALFENGKFKIFDLKNGLLNDRVYGIIEDNAGKIWIGTNEGITIFENEKPVAHLSEKDGLSSKRIRALFKDKSGKIWIGTGGNGLNLWDNGKLTLYGEKEGFGKWIIYAIYEDKANNLWIGTSGGGLKRFSNNQFASYSVEDGLSDNMVRSFLEDTEGNLWVGTYNGGVNLFREGKFTPYTTKEGLASNMMFSIYEDIDNSVLLGSYGGGLIKWKNGVFSNINSKDGLSSNLVGSILRDRTGKLWVGTYGQGVNLIDDSGHVTIFDEIDGIKTESISAIFEDKKQRIWFGTYIKGLYLYENGKATNFSTANGLKSNMIRVIGEDKSGNVWIGTDGGGVSVFSDSGIKTYTTENGLSNNLVFSFYCDKEGVVWVGTYGGGISVFRKGKWSNISRKNGLFDDVVYSLLEDKKGKFWMSSNKGIFTASRQELIDFIDGKIKYIESLSYGISDGMRTTECNGGFQSSGLIRKDGILWFPTVAGIVEANPENIPVNRYKIPVYIEKIVADEKPVSILKKLTLPPSTDKLEFHYTGLSYVAPSKVKFKYMLKGYDKKWVDADKRRVAYYTNLAPGKYTFMVMAANADNVWNETAATISFEKKPYFYQTLWFYGALILLLLELIYLLTRWRIKQIKQRNKMLENLVEKRTEELKGANSELTKAYAELKEISLRDPMTALRNRRYLIEIILEETQNHAITKSFELKKGEPRGHISTNVYGVYLIDLDHFKMVNDTYGHESGDMVLKQLAEIFRKITRKDDVVTRWGGEEFVIILRDTKAEFLPQFADKIRKAVENYDFKIADGSTIRKTCSTGFLQFPFFEDKPELISVEHCIALADHGLYYAKSHGRNLSVELIPHRESRAKEFDLTKLLSSADYGINEKIIELKPRTKSE